MVDAISKITLYVENQEKAKAFWTEQMGFVVRQEQQMGAGMWWLEVAPSEEASTVFVLYEKRMMQDYKSEVFVGHPSVMLSTCDLERAHREMKEKGVLVGEMERMPYGNMFHFSDQEGNVYLLQENKK